MPNQPVIDAADELTRQITASFAAGDDRATVVRSAAGAGKSGLVTSTTCGVARAGRRVAVTAPTNDQVADLVRRCAAREPEIRFILLHKSSSFEVPADVAALPNVTCTKDSVAAAHAPVVFATNDKFAFSAADLGTFDRLILDEAYQSDSTRYLCISRLAPVHLLVGDGGQLDPFSIADCSRWRGQPEDPLLTAIGVLLLNHPGTRVENMPLSRRLSPSAVQVVQPSFYGPDLPFAAATMSDERQLRLQIPAASRGFIDAGLEMAARTGWSHVELPDSPALLADPEAAEVVAGLVSRLFERGPEARCEKSPALHPLSPSTVGVAVSHNVQVDLVRRQLDSLGLRDVAVLTANRMQGLEFEVTIVWHPLCGLPDLDEFHLDPGRMCVMLTRHRHACIVVGRAGDREHARRQPPTTPTYLGWDPDPVMDGWEAHRQVFHMLEPYVVSAA